MKKNLLKLIITVYLVSSILFLGTCEGGLFGGGDEDTGSYLGDDIKNVDYQIKLTLTDLPPEYNDGDHIAGGGFGIGNSKKNRKTVAGVVDREYIKGDSVTLPLFDYNNKKQPFKKIGDFSVVFYIQKVERDDDGITIKRDKNGKQIIHDIYSGAVTMPITGENTFISIHELSPF